ncbi:ABC transporter ATP-binding protein [Streptomyces sp. VRA16 Mangrove soil]|uniref:oligopeptide/dipeptide ABC transporter ATP-binding protein n=1 Tax=Streptomyces sp. VRA16 Mangrove soil TaxID=2817434 RepID=UPI001A9D41DC|nr:ABC transporter ATP-binding protein [Streptomyces sp. VRA16 Mangrove soil]MBO1331861.1 ABC transporter ATP-binding protein [Streptomyces sp. VRA16 Mangrove soil]
MTEPDTPLLELRGITRHFKVGTGLSRRLLHAVDDVDLSIGAREIVALVGESGSGKSTLARLVAQVHRPTKGDILYQGRPLSDQRGRRAKLAYRGAVPMVFQDPFSSLNPAYRVSHGILRGITLHQPRLGRAERQAEAERVTEAVGLGPEVLGRYPYELSGGQRQRIGFAQALAHRPRLILADEPVSMLDVSIRIGLLNVMAELRETEGVSLLYITHDIASARYLADRIAVMYGGHIVETGPTEEVLAHPRHPYTDLLLSAVPDPRAPLDVDAATAKSDPPVVIDPTPGCRFRARCPLAVDVCAHVTPRLNPVAAGHTAACHVNAPVPAADGATA